MRDRESADSMRDIKKTRKPSRLFICISRDGTEELFLNAAEIVRLARARGMTKTALLRRLRQLGLTRLAWKMQNFKADWVSLKNIPFSKLLTLLDELAEPPKLPDSLIPIISQAQKILQIYLEGPKIKGRIIAKWRKELGLTQAELARLTKLPRSTLSDLERGAFKAGLPLLGKYRSPFYEKLYRDKLEKVAKVLDALITRQS